MSKHMKEVFEHICFMDAKSLTLERQRSITVSFQGVKRTTDLLALMKRLLFGSQYALGFTVSLIIFFILYTISLNCNKNI